MPGAASTTGRSPGLSHHHHLYAADPVQCPEVDRDPVAASLERDGPPILRVAPEGWIERGEVVVVFQWDGSSDAAQIVISDPDSRSVDLDIAPLLEMVRIREETD